jgi:hypothetical protein
MTTTKKVYPAGEEPKAKAGPGRTHVIAAIVLLLLAVIGVAVAVPLALANDGSSSDPMPTVEVSFKGSGEVNDYDEAAKTAVLDAMATAAGFLSTPSGSSITVTAASVLFKCTFPVATAEDAQAKGTALTANAGSKDALQAILTSANVPITVEAAPEVQLLDIPADHHNDDHHDDDGHNHGDGHDHGHEDEKEPLPPPPHMPPSPAPPPPLPANHGPFSSGCQAIPLAGRWMGNYGTSFVVNNTMWAQLSTWGQSYYEITQFTASMIIMKNPADDSYNAGKWSKIQHHSNGDGTHSYCMGVYDAASEEAAVAATMFYDANNATHGCGGSFGFSIISPYAMPVANKWVGNYGTQFTITDDHWYEASEWGTSTYTIFAYTSTYAILQNPADDSYNPGKWTKVEYHKVSSEGFHFCKTKYDAASWKEAYAEDTSAVYNTSDADAGCNGFGHSITTPMA